MARNSRTGLENDPWKERTASLISTFSIDCAREHMATTSDTSEAAVSIKSVRSQIVLALRATIANYRAQSQLWHQLCSACEAHGITIAGPCLTLYYDLDYKESDVDCEVCLPIAQDAVIPESLLSGSSIVLKELSPLQKAACITHEGSYDGLPTVYCTAFQWLAQQQLQACVPLREVYLRMDPSDKSERSFLTEVQLPIKDDAA